jgi:transposase
MLFPPSVLERAMKVKEVIMRALNKEYSWLRAAEILGISVRGLRRLRERMETVGFEGLIDMRCGRPSPRRTPVVEVERILGLYRDRYPGYNARHFYQTVRREHGVELSYTHVRQLLQGAGLRKKGRARGRHRMRRERKACFGEMLHLDGSLHEWLALLPGEKQTLIQVVDDATTQVMYAQLWDSESSLAVMSALKEVIGEHGIPMSLYTDRAAWAFETPKAGAKVDKSHMTQVGQALARLGIEHIPSYSPQARGRSERMNRTLQDRLVNELKAAKISTVDDANRYLRERYIPTHNEALAKPPQDPTSVFVELGDVDLDEIFFEETVRTVAKDNTVTHQGIRFQIYPQPGRRSCAGLAVQVRRHLDGTYSIRRGAQLFGYYDEKAGPVETAGPVENRKRPRFPTRTLDAGKRSRRPQLPQAPTRS